MFPSIANTHPLTHLGYTQKTPPEYGGVFICVNVPLKTHSAARTYKPDSVPVLPTEGGSKTEYPSILVVKMLSGCPKGVRLGHSILYSPSVNKNSDNHLSRHTITYMLMRHSERL